MATGGGESTTTRCARVVILATVYKTDHVAINPCRELVDGGNFGTIACNARRFFLSVFVSRETRGATTAHADGDDDRARAVSYACVSFSVCLFRAHSWIVERYGGVGEGRDARARG